MARHAQRECCDEGECPAGWGVDRGTQAYWEKVNAHVLCSFSTHPSQSMLLSIPLRLVYCEAGLVPCILTTMSFVIVLAWYSCPPRDPQFSFYVEEQPSVSAMNGQSYSVAIDIQVPMASTLPTFSIRDGPFSFFFFFFFLFFPCICSPLRSLDFNSLSLSRPISPSLSLYMLYSRIQYILLYQEACSCPHQPKEVRGCSFAQLCQRTRTLSHGIVPCHVMSCHQSYVMNQNVLHPSWSHFQVFF